MIERPAKLAPFHLAFGFGSRCDGDNEKGKDPGSKADDAGGIAVSMSETGLAANHCGFRRDNSHGGLALSDAGQSATQ